MVLHWRLSDSKSLQVSRTLLSILVILKNAVVWMVSTRPPTSKSASPFNNPLVTVPNAPITIGIIVTFMLLIYEALCFDVAQGQMNGAPNEIRNRHFHVIYFFLIPWQGRGTYPSFHFVSVLFCGQPRQQSRQFCKCSFFFVDYYKVWCSGRD